MDCSIFTHLEEDLLSRRHSVCYLFVPVLFLCGYTLLSKTRDLEVFVQSAAITSTVMAWGKGQILGQDRRFSRGEGLARTLDIQGEVDVVDVEGWVAWKWVWTERVSMALKGSCLSYLTVPRDRTHVMRLKQEYRTRASGSERTRITKDHPHFNIKHQASSIKHQTSSDHQSRALLL